jgi:hypothetical protein
MVNLAIKAVTGNSKSCHTSGFTNSGMPRVNPSFSNVKVLLSMEFLAPEAVGGVGTPIDPVTHNEAFIRAQPESTTSTSKKIPMPQKHISIAQSCLAGDWHRQNWEVKDACNDKSEFKSTLAKSRSQEECAYGRCDVMIGNSQNRMSTTLTSHQDQKMQGVTTQRKRTSDGRLKCEQNRCVDDMRASPLEACKDGQNYNTTLQKDMDILRRRIAAMRAQDQKSNGLGPRSRWATASKQCSKGEGKQASYTGHSLLEWEEAVLR